MASLALLAAWTSFAAPQNTPPPKRLSYDNYRMVQMRNIFDPDRRAMVIAQVASSSSTDVSSKPVTRADYIALTGVMVTDEGALAFFSGSRPEFNKVLPVKGSVAGATISGITPENIVVVRDGKQITVAVGQTVPFDNSAPVAAPVATLPDGSASSPSASSFSTSSPSASSSSSGTSSAPGNLSDVMKRMMERRQQELK